MTPSNEKIISLKFIFDEINCPGTDFADLFWIYVGFSMTVGYINCQLFLPIMFTIDKMANFPFDLLELKFVSKSTR